MAFVCLNQISVTDYSLTKDFLILYHFNPTKLTNLPRSASRNLIFRFISKLKFQTPRHVHDKIGSADQLQPTQQYPTEHSAAPKAFEDALATENPFKVARLTVMFTRRSRFVRLSSVFLGILQRRRRRQQPSHTKAKRPMSWQYNKRTSRCSPTGSPYRPKF
jgi:hypothetical protein